MSRTLRAMSCLLALPVVSPMFQFNPKFGVWTCLSVCCTPGTRYSNQAHSVVYAQITGLDDKDIVFVRFEGEGGPHCLPYFIGLDHEKESVVVSIRGTLSVEARRAEYYKLFAHGLGVELV